jgi:hypothetical protein
MHGTPQSKTAVRLVFAAVALACVIQYYLSTRLGEPYPSLRMPGFAGAGGYQDGKVRIRRLEVVFVTADGETVSFSQRDLLGDFPTSYHDVIAQSFLSPLPKRTESSLAQSSRTGISHQLFPGWRTGILDRTSADQVTSLRVWLLRRAHTLVPGRKVDRVEFHWYDDTFQNNSGHLTSQRQPAGVFSVRLTGGPQ